MGNHNSGVRPLPTSLKILNGTRESRINRHEPRPRVAMPELPAEATPAVRAVWDRIVRELQAMGIAHAADQDTLRAYCETVVMHARACELLADQDLVMTGAQGTTVRNPLVAQIRDMAGLMRTLANEFGLTPVGRSRITTEKRPLEQVSNPFAGDG